jgi:hypothetical protein
MARARIVPGLSLPSASVNPRQRLTVDIMVFRDYLERRKGYPDAAALLEFHRRGEVELGAASSGYLIDATKLGPTGDRASGKLWQDLHALFEAEGITETVQLAYPGVMVPGPGAIPGAAVEGFGVAWDAALASWPGNEKKPGDNDRLHVETHLLEGRDVLITNDGPLLAMCGRLRAHGLAVTAMTVAEYLASR